MSNSAPFPQALHRLVVGAAQTQQKPFRWFCMLARVRDEVREGEGDEGVWERRRW